MKAESSIHPSATGPGPALPGVDLSVVVPVYNEIDNLVPLVDEIEAALAPLGRPYEVLLVDDGSRDGSRELIRRLVDERPGVRAVLFRRNAGQSAAFDAGFRHAAGAVLVTMDADLQNDPRDIPAMVARLEQGFDLVSGWRKDRKDGMVLRLIPSRVANALIRRVTGTRVHDLGCSLRVYRRAITDELRLYGEMHRFLVVLAEGQGVRVDEVEVRHRARRAGDSKYGLGRTFKVVLDLLTVWFMQSFQTKPIYIFGGTGAGMIGLSALLSAFVLWERLAQGIYVHRNPLFLVGILLFITGVQMLSVGLLAEIIIRTYFESRGRPAYAIAEVLGAPGATRPARG